MHTSVTVDKALDRKTFLCTFYIIFFLHSLSLVVMGKERTGQENYFFKCKLDYLKILIRTQLSFQVGYEGLLYLTRFQIDSCPLKTLLLV